jgi:uncharacterized CHY-type Zn-finger protein
MEGEKFPICPHCAKEINGIEWFHEDNANIRIFICPHCRKILSIQEWYGPMPAIPLMPVMPTQSEIL